MNRNKKLARALGWGYFGESKNPYYNKRAYFIRDAQTCAAVNDAFLTGRSFERWLGTPEGQQAIRDKVHCEIGGSGYEIKIKVCERGRTDYGLWDAKTRLSVQPATRMKRDSLNVADDLPAFYADCLLWLTKEGK